MEVMVWFYENYKYFAPLLQNEDQESKERRDSKEDEDDKEETPNVHSFRKKEELVDEMSMPQENLSDPRIPFPDDELFHVTGISMSKERHSESGISLPAEDMGHSANFTEVMEPVNVALHHCKLVRARFEAHHVEIAQVIRKLEIKESKEQNNTT